MPKIVNIDQEEFEKLCTYYCTLADISNFFKCSEDTIENWCKKTYKRLFSDISEEKRGLVRLQLRRKQIQVALSGNVSMLIWLGKNLLDQTDKAEIKETLDALPKLIVEIEKGEAARTSN